jgi:hypothetical protein
MHEELLAQAADGLVVLPLDVHRVGKVMRPPEAVEHGVDPRPLLSDRAEENLDHVGMVGVERVVDINQDAVARTPCSAPASTAISLCAPLARQVLRQRAVPLALPRRHQEAAGLGRILERRRARHSTHVAFPNRACAK